MTEYLKPQPIDDNGNVIMGGKTVEFQICTATQSSANTISFSTDVKAVIFGSRTAANDIAMWIGTTTKADTSAFWTIQGGDTINLDITYSGPYYFRGLSAVTSLVEGIAIL